MTRRGRWCSLIALAPLSVSAVVAVDVPVAGRALVVRGEPVARVRRAIFKSSKDPSVVLSGDPAVVGASVSFNSLDCAGGPCVLTGGTGEISLDPQQWRALGNPPGARGYRYHDKDGTIGGIRTVVLKPGRLVVKAFGSGWPWVPSGPVERAVVEVRVGGDRYCAEFGGTVRANVDGSLRFLKAPAPVACREYCGNGIAEAGESCDGNDDDVCLDELGGCLGDCSCPQPVCTDFAQCNIFPCCDENAFCLQVPLEHICTAKPGLGQTCEFASVELPCGPGLACCTVGIGFFPCPTSARVCCATTAACVVDSDCCLYGSLGVGCTDGACCVDVNQPCQVFGESIGPCCGDAVCEKADSSSTLCCLPAGEPCGSNEECCSDVCDPIGGACQ